MNELSRNDRQYLRKGVGLTVAKLGQRPSICLFCGVGANDPLAAHDRIIHELEQVPDTKQRRALRNALGIAIAEPGELHERRSDFAKAEGVSTDTIENWENRSLDELLVRLSRYTYRSSVVITDAESLCVVHHRLIEQAVERREIRANQDGLADFSHDVEPGTILEPMTGERWETTADNEQGTVFTVFFDPPLQSHERRSYGFRYGFPQTDPDTEGWYSQRFNVPTERYRLRVRFADEQPQQAWYFENRPLVLVENEDPLPDEVLAVRDSEVERVFLHLGNGQPTGIAWRW